MSITLQRESVSPSQAPPRQHTWPLRIIATSNLAGLSSKIFVFHAALSDDLIKGDVFEAVASVSQLMELPEDTPITGGDVIVPFYRLDRLEWFCHSAEEAEDLWNKIQEDVQDLVNNFRSKENLESSEVIVIT